jgi:5-carboxymethyl-2-hydroxymuconate isomerase
MNITLSIDEQTVKRAREKLQAVGKSVNEEIREHLAHVAGDNDLELAIEDFRSRAGRGKPDIDWKWNRDEIYEERTRWPRA